MATQTVRHRDYFLPITRQGEVITADDHADIPTARAALVSLSLLGLALTVVVSSLTVVPGRATPLQGGVHLVVFAAYLELAINP